MNRLAAKKAKNKEDRPRPRQPTQAEREMRERRRLQHEAEDAEIGAAFSALSQQANNGDDSVAVPAKGSTKEP